MKHIHIKVEEKQSNFNSDELSSKAKADISRLYAISIGAVAHCKYSEFDGEENESPSIEWIDARMVIAYHKIFIYFEQLNSSEDTVSNLIVINRDSIKNTRFSTIYTKDGKKYTTIDLRGIDDISVDDKVINNVKIEYNLNNSFIATCVQQFFKGEGAV